MKQAGEFLSVISSTFFFCTAVALLFLQARTLSNSYQSVKQVILGSEILYETENEADKKSFLSEEEEVRGEELAIMLVSGLTCDITIDERMIDKVDFDYQKFDFTSLGEVYKKQYQYNEDGSINRILYIGKEKQE